MEIEVLEKPEQALIDYLGKKIDDINLANWEVTEKIPLAVQIKNDAGEVVAGAAGRSFGDWLLLNTLWVSDTLRGQNIGSQILEKVEKMGKSRGCVKCFLETLSFHAKPFYEKHGYDVQWAQEGYPITSSQYYMVKQLYD